MDSAIPGLSREDAYSREVPLPPLDEQRAIADYLDEKDEQITRFIESRKRMIALLEEKKQAVINQAVTKGLDPSVPMKDSGVEWLGEIPAHWELRPAKYTFREVDRRAIDESLPRLSMSQRYGLVTQDEIESWRMQSESAIGAKIANAGDLVLNRLKAHLSVFATSPKTGTVSPDYTVLRPKTGIESRYFEALLRTAPYRSILRRSVKGIVEGFWRLYTDDFYRIRLIVPPLEEQKTILEFVDTTEGSVRDAVDRIEKSLQAVSEYRIALVSAGVTGRITPLQEGR